MNKKNNRTIEDPQPSIHGTGGIGDVVTYLKERLLLHNRLTKIHPKVPCAHSVLGALDRKDLDEFFDFMDENILFQFSMNPQIFGIALFKQNVEQLFETIASVHHHIHGEYRHDNLIIVEGTANYSFPSGAIAAVPFCDIWKLTTEDLIIEYKIYCDSSFLSMTK